MLTIFTTPKPFRGPFARLQRNAITSWTRLSPPCDVLIFGDEEGAADIAADLHLTHLAAVARNEFGMPLIGDLFAQAQQTATTPFLCYANADIIFMDDLLAAVRTAAICSERFLLIGQRYDVDLQEPLDFSPGWAARLRRMVIDGGFTLNTGMDYFGFPRGLWTTIPDDLVVGRAGWDSWPICEARLQKATVIDATQMVTAVHQKHDYSHHPGGVDEVYGGVEATRNYHALGGRRNMLTTFDATHVLTERGLVIRCRSCYPMCVCKPSSF
jgi:hypothetical protein